MKRRSSLDSAQLLFTFEPATLARSEAALAGFDRFVAAGVGRALKEDGRSRAEIAGAMSALLDEEVTRFMLDAYASEAREQHNIPFHRGFALVAATDRFDILDAFVRRIGGHLLVGEEIRTAQLGHLDRQIAALKDQKRALEGRAKPIDRNPGRSAR